MLCLDANPARRGRKPANNRLSYGTALNQPLVKLREVHFAFAWETFANNALQKDTWQCAIISNDFLSVFFSSSEKDTA
jgi:hypothetical protein